MELLDLNVAVKSKESDSLHPRHTGTKGCLDLKLHHCFSCLVWGEIELGDV